MAIYGQMVVPQKAAGAALPTNGQTPAPYVPGAEVSARYSDAGGALAGQGARQSAQALGELGRALGGATIKLEDVYIRYQETRARDAYNRYVQEEMQMRPEWDRLQGANAIDEKSGVIAQKSRWQADARARYEKELGGMARNMFMRQADQYDAQTNAWALTKTNREMEAYQDSTDKGTVSIATQRALNDPSYLPQAMGVIMAVNQRKGARKGWSPEAVQAQTQDDVGVMFAGAIGNMVMVGDLQGAMNLFSQARQFLPADKAAMLQQHIGSGVIAHVRAQVEAGDIAGARRTLESAGSPAFAGGAGQPGSWNQGVAAEAARRRGMPHGGVGSSNDCSAYTGAIWRGYIADPQVRQAIFGPDGGRSTSENIVQETANRTQGGRLLGNAELAPGMVGAGMVIGIDSGPHSHDKGRRLGIDHIVSTYMGADGRLMVTESSSDKRPGGGVHDTPYDQWYAANSKHRLFGATLVPLLQGGAQAGASGVPAGWQEWTGERGNSIPERQHNPGAVKPPEGYSSFRSDAEGFLAQAKALRNEKYYGGKNIEQIVLTYVGYNPDKDYWAKVKEQGFSLKEVPNLKDNKVLARLMIGLARGESNLGKHYEPEQIEALLAGGAQLQPQPQAQALPAGVDQSKWDALYQNTRGDAELAAVGYKLGYAKAMEWADAGRKIETLPKDVQAFLQEVKQNGGKPKAGAPAQAPAMQSPAGALPAGPAGETFLSPAQQYQGQAMLNRGSENQATKILQGLKDAETKARLSGDTSMLEDIAGGLRAIGSDKAEQVQRRVDFWKGNEQTRQWAVQATLPQLAEQIQAVDRQIAPETAKGLPVEELEKLHAQRELLVTMAKERAGALKKDPALAADKDPGSGITEGQTSGDKARSRLAWQERQGVGEFDRKALTKLEAENIKQNWNKASSEQKAARLGELVKIYGENAPQVLSEIGISPMEQDVASVVLADGAMANRATEVFRIMALKPKEIPGLEKAPLDEVQSALEDSEVYQAVLRHYQATLDPASSTMRAQMEDFAKRAKKIGKSDKEIREFLDLGRKAYVDDNAAVVVPKGMTEEQVEAGLKWAMDGLLKKFLQEGRPDLKGGPAGYTVGEEMSRLKAVGLWVASPDGNGFIMMDSVTKKPVTNSRGQIFIVSREQIQNYLSHSGVELSAGDEDE